MQEMEGLDLWVRSSRVVGNGSLLQYSCLEKITWTEKPGSPEGCKESDTIEHMHIGTTSNNDNMFILDIFILLVQGHRCSVKMRTF